MIDCEDIIRKALGRDLYENEADDFIKQAGETVKKLKAKAQADASLPDIVDLARQHNRNAELAALAKKRNTYMQIKARAGVLDFCLTNFRGMEAEGINALLGGSRYARVGARLSVDQIGNELEGSYIGQLFTDLKALGPEYVKLFNNRSQGRQIAEAMFLIGGGREKEFQGNPYALKIARVISSVQERAREDANRAGAWIGKIPGYIVRQSHDQAKIKRAGYEAWRDFISPRLDWQKIHGGEIDPAVNPEGAENFLKETWSALSTGNHLKYVREANVLASGSNIGSEAARLSHERVLHFKSGGDWYDYNAKFGTNSFHEAIGSGLRHTARGTALMKNFGPSPNATLEWVLDALKKTLRERGDMAAEEKVTQMEKSLRGKMSLADGTANRDGNIRAAEIGRNARALESMAKLGGAVVSSISDIGNVHYEFAYQGMGFFNGMGNALREFVNGVPSLEKQRVCSSLGVFFDSLTGGISARFYDDTLSGKMAAAQNLYFKLSLLTFWTDNWKKSVVLTLSHHMATMKDNAWQNLGKPYQRALSLYGIDEGRWDILRKSAAVEADGRDYFTPDGLANLDDSHFAHYLESQGRAASQGAIMQLRDDMQNQLRAYFRDRVQYAVLEPDLNNRYLLGRANAAGTAGGEVMRYVTQFKSFPTLFMQRVMGREIYGRGYEKSGIWNGIKGAALSSFRASEYGDKGNMIQMFVAMTAFGYLAMQSKALLAGKNPREMTKETCAQVVLASMVQGGGLGIIGDFLFGDFSRMGHGLTSTLAGPAFGSADTLAQIISKLRNGEDLKASVADFIWTHIPGNNLFYLNLAMRRMFLDHIYNTLNPGYSRRVEQNAWRNNRQTFWLPPSR